METVEKLNKSTFEIKVYTDNERYDGKPYISTILKVDYDNYTYKIITPEIDIELGKKLPELVSKSIDMAYRRARIELRELNDGGGEIVRN